MLSKLTLIGLHNYTSGKIWDNLELPEGIDKDILVNEILRQNGEFPVIYPDPEFLKIQITYWSKKWYHNFERWVAANTKQYEALFNVDVTTTTTDEVKDNGADTKNFNMQRSGSNNGGSNGTAENKKAAYDTSTYQPVTYDSTNSSTSLSTSESEMHSESNSNSWEHSQTMVEVKQGNQGITMSQELLLAEYNAWLFNLYTQIADVFASEFCITLYD